jgi:hypothetical protein
MKEKLLLLKSEMLDDRQRLVRLMDRFQTVWDSYGKEKDYSLLVEAAFTVNQVYTGCERIFRNIASTFENSIDENLWHRAILDRMRLEIEDVRPALLSERSYDHLSELLAFRHYFRHAYDSDIREDKFEIVASSTLELRELLLDDIENFIDFVDKLITAS